MFKVLISPCAPPCIAKEFENEDNKWARLETRSKGVAFTIDKLATESSTEKLFPSDRFVSFNRQSRVESHAS